MNTLHFHLMSLLCANIDDAFIMYITRKNNAGATLVPRQALMMRITYWRGKHGFIAAYRYRAPRPRISRCHDDARPPGAHARRDMARAMRRGRCDKPLTHMKYSNAHVNIARLIYSTSRLLAGDDFLLSVTFISRL